MTELPEPFMAGLERALDRRALLTDEGDIARYCVDFWGQSEGRTSLVVRPADTEAVSRVLELAYENGIAIVPQAGNTGLVGGGVPDRSGRQVVLSLERMDRVRFIDEAGQHITAEAGAILADVQEAAAAEDRLFPLSLGSEGSCRIGGLIGTNAGGLNVLRYGMTRDLVLGLEVVMADGRIWDGLKALRKDNSGYDLKQLFIGSEGTLGVVTAAVMRLFPRPRETVTLWLGIASPAEALRLLELFQDHVGELISSFELLAERGVRAAAEHLDGARYPLEREHPWHLLIEVDWALTSGLSERVETILETAVTEGLIGDGTIAQSEEQRAGLWRVREEQSEATRHLGEILRSDISVPVPRLPAFLERAEAHFAGRDGVLLAPFGHVGDGNLHFNFILTGNGNHHELRSSLTDELVDLVVAFDGSISAEHGIGRLKPPLLARTRPALDLELMRRLKHALDPKGILNPGVIVGSRS